MVDKPSPTLHFYLPSPMREDAAGGRVNIVNRIAEAVGWPLEFHPDGEAERAQAAGRGGYHLVHMQEPTAPDMLCLRRAYHYPFWQIEATNERWRFDVAQAQFDGGEVDAAAAKGFFRRWRDKLLGGVAAAPERFIFMPLQGRLLQHRSFQTMSPMAMIEATLAADKRPIRATLHPKESYGAEELDALAALSLRFPRFQLVQGDTRALLAACAFVVTQNSSVALTGFFAQKRAVLFAGADFHHIAGSVFRDGVAAGFGALQGPPPDFAAYLYWFFKRHCVNGGAPEAEDQIVARLRRHGWPL